MPAFICAWRMSKGCNLPKLHAIKDALQKLPKNTRLKYIDFPRILIWSPVTLANHKLLTPG